MWKLQNYRIHYDFWGIALFLMIMVPNLIWALLPAPQDVLRQGTLTENLDQLSAVVQVLMIGSICFLVNRTFHRPVEQRNLIGICTAVILYLFGWIFYFMGFTGPLVIITLSVSPCLAFLLFAWGRKNGFGVLFSLLFLILHTLRGILNYMV